MAMSHDTLTRIVSQYGEAIMVSKVMKILNCGRKKVLNLVEDGLLTRCADGTKITAASVAAYLDGGPKAIDHQRRMQKKYPGIRCV